MKYDIFISYRRKDNVGRSNVPTARQFKLAFEAPPYNYKVFFDYSECTDDYFADTILPAIKTCDYFVLILTKDSLVRCSNEGDWVRREIEEAISSERKIVPITPDKECESLPQGLPDSLSKLEGLQITTVYTDHMFDAGIDFLVKNRFCMKKVSTDSGSERHNQEELESVRLEIAKIYEALFADMLENIIKYNSMVMQVLFGIIPTTEELRNEDTPIGDFLRAGLTLNFGDLYRKGLLPEGNRALEKAIFEDDVIVPQHPYYELGEVPSGRNDVYFLGCSGSGKSSMMAGMLNYLSYVGEMQYLPTRNSRGVDGSRSYYNALIRSVGEFKAPCSIGENTVSFMQLNVGPNFDREITTVELSGDAFYDISQANVTGGEVWLRLGLKQSIRNNNPKTLFFLLDYSTIIGKNPRFSAVQQEMILSNVLEVFSSDGTGRYGEINCTMSKVKTVAVVVTKSDLMDVAEGRRLTPDERADVAFDYLNVRFSNFMNNLAVLCHKYDINANNKGHANAPFVTTFSLGQFFIGNSLIYDNTDSKRLAEFIVAATDKRRRGFLSFL